MNAIFDQAVKSSGPQYHEYERQLLEGPEPETSQMLSNRLGNPDPMVKLMARAFLDGKGERAKDHKEAAAYLRALPWRLVGAVNPNPGPLELATSLDSDFKDHVANFLAVMLVKDCKDDRRDVSPKWLKQGLIVYLQQQKIPSTTAGLIRFAEETEDPELRDAAVQAIKAIPDPELPGKIEAERKKARAQRKDLPLALEALKTTKRKRHSD